MLETRVRLVNPLGLHARAAAMLVRCASQFSSEIMLCRLPSGDRANARSILDLLALGASFGTTIHITADGEDEVKALEEIGRLLETGFGEI